MAAVSTKRKRDPLPAAHAPDPPLPPPPSPTDPIKNKLIRAAPPNTTGPATLRLPVAFLRDFLACNLCSGLLHDPVSIPSCSHVFCFGCLRDFNANPTRIASFPARTLRPDTPLDKNRTKPIKREGRPAHASADTLCPACDPNKSEIPSTATAVPDPTLRRIIALLRSGLREIGALPSVPTSANYNPATRPQPQPRNAASAATQQNDASARIPQGAGSKAFLSVAHSPTPQPASSRHPTLAAHSSSRPGLTQQPVLQAHQVNVIEKIRIPTSADEVRFELRPGKLKNGSGGSRSPRIASQNQAPSLARPAIRASGLVSVLQLQKYLRVMLRLAESVVVELSAAGKILSSETTISSILAKTNHQASTGGSPDSGSTTGDQDLLIHYSVHRNRG